MNRRGIGYNALMRLTPLIGSAVLAAALAAGVHAAAGSRAHVAVTDRSPFTVHGSGFRIGERVIVTASVPGHFSRKAVRAGGGTFTVRFTGLSAKACAAYQVRAVGSLGDTAVVRFMPECAPGPTQ